MSRITIRDDELVISLPGAKRIDVLKDEFTIPISKIKDAYVDDEVWKNKPNFIEREWGAGIFGHYYGGIYVQDGKRIFYDLKRGEKPVVIQLLNENEYKINRKHILPRVDENFNEIIIGVDIPEDVIQMIHEAIKKT